MNLHDLLASLPSFLIQLKWKCRRIGVDKNLRMKKVKSILLACQHCNSKIKPSSASWRNLHLKTIQIFQVCLFEPAAQPGKKFAIKNGLTVPSDISNICSAGTPMMPLQATPPSRRRQNGCTQERKTETDLTSPVHSQGHLQRHYQQTCCHSQARH
jgi:hypothetical protein